MPVRFDGMAWHAAPAAVAEASFERAEVYRAIEAAGPIFPSALAERLEPAASRPCPTCRHAATYGPSKPRLANATFNW